MKSSLGLRDQGYSYMTEGFMEENNISSSHKCTECVAQISQLMTITAKCRGIQGLEHKRLLQHMSIYWVQRQDMVLRKIRSGN